MLEAVIEWEESQGLSEATPKKPREKGEKEYRDLWS